MNANTLAVIAALPWIISPVVTALRLRNTKSLDEERSDAPLEPPLVSVVIPARNEARNIERCLRSVLTASYPNLEVVVVDDHSADGTGDIARSIASTDARVRVIANADLPIGWFGKQWACQNGAAASRGEIICFADADTTHSSDLITRSVNAIRRRCADLFSVAGKQELGTFWERLVQPMIFAIMLARYGGTESVTNSRRISDKIANGQCLFVRRDVYDSLGGHALVKSHVADDMMMAQRFFARGKKVVLMEGVGQLSTRMYTSLAELVHGWGKNVFAGGQDSVPFGVVGRAFFPLLLLVAPLIGLVPPVVLLASPFGWIPQPVILWGAISSVALFVWWIYVYRGAGVPRWYALIAPVGMAILFYIFLRAVIRGRHVAWKGREYSHSSIEDPA